MGVPALFRWLSKKYPKIVEQVIEDTPLRNEVAGGYEELPIDMSQRNPNGVEFDNLYLDMNGIVHPCTHPEGKKAPETEEEMMIEVFKYTERVVNMVRPRKLLMIAIDGVAPRAKMNQQRSRRFRAAQDAKVKEEEKQAAIREWRLKGKELSEEYTNEKKAWDSNAITPGTPFMTLLTESLRYWIVHKMNTDKGWNQIQVILSDASVPGEGEHKIMDFIRRQRTQPAYDPNTKHVIYGLDADLIMLSLATHEPHFKVLREDVFADQKKGRGCHTCGQLGHHSSQCQGKPKEKVDEFDTKNKPVERKPFIFLDVSTLREYLAVELNLGALSFPFDLERAIDDWVLLIFFVGNDFLPHLPSLEIREGAIDTLLKIWKSNLDRMGGYLTDCGRLNLKRTEIILEGLAAKEDEIFRKRQEAEERQDRDAKKRKIDQDHNTQSAPVSQPYVPVKPTSALESFPTSSGSFGKPAFLPLKPAEASFEPIPGLGHAATSNMIPVSMMSNADIVKNRFVIRSANLDAAAMLKAELSGKLDLPSATSIVQSVDQVPNSLGAPQLCANLPQNAGASDMPNNATGEKNTGPNDSADSVNLTAVPNLPVAPSQKRKVGEIEEQKTAQAVQEDQVVLLSEDEDDEEEDAGNVSVFIPGQPSKPAPLKLVGNNMAEQDDTVKLWEPGYRERYFRQKFGIELSDLPARRKIVKHYVEGLAWVLAYYYQGCQSWQWFYPYHYSPFAADFTQLDELEIKFELGQPFKPYEQLMGVFPAASRSHIPAVFHELMTSIDSPIKDFYPEEFEIDMNGKKMVWQGIALLPFIEQDRLLQSMKMYEDQLSTQDQMRNDPGSVVMFCSEGHPQYDNLCRIYRKRDTKEPVSLDPATANGVFGSALPDPNCIPGSTFHSPLPQVGLPDIPNDKSIFARFFFPSQLVPHRSYLLRGVRVEKRTLNNYDREVTRRGGSGGGGGGNYYGDGFHQQRRDMGDGPGIMSHYRTGSGYGSGRDGNHSYRDHQNGFQHNQNQHYGPQSTTVGHGYRDNYAGFSSALHRGEYSNYQASFYNSSPYSRPHSHSNDFNRPNAPYQAPRSHQPPAGSYGGGYGGTGVGLPARPSTGSSGHQNGRGYRPPPITPAVTRPNQPKSNGYPPSSGSRR